MADDDKVLEIVELARNTGKVKKGTNEATKALERATAKLVVVAGDVSPKEIIMHLKLLAEEKGIKYAEVDKKEDLGAAAGLQVGTSAVAVLDAGEAKKQLESL